MKEMIMNLTLNSSDDDIKKFTDTYVPETIPVPDVFMLLVTYASLDATAQKLFQNLMTIAGVPYSTEVEKAAIAAGLDPDKVFRVSYDQIVESARKLVVEIVAFPANALDIVKDDVNV